MQLKLKIFFKNCFNCMSKIMLFCVFIIFQFKLFSIFLVISSLIRGSLHMCFNSQVFGDFLDTLLLLMSNLIPLESEKSTLILWSNM